jgi:hypothetical protein
MEESPPSPSPLLYLPTFSMVCFLSDAIIFYFTLYTLKQLAGNKTVRLLPPRAVGSVRPDPSRKHWPGAPPSELSNWKQENGWWECELTPGDQLFVPLMW